MCRRLVAKVTMGVTKMIRLFRGWAAWTVYWIGCRLEDIGLPYQVYSPVILFSDDIQGASDFGPWLHNGENSSEPPGK